jgi:hypothetical protein
VERADYYDRRFMRATLECLEPGCTATHQAHWLYAEEMQARGWWCPGHEPSQASSAALALDHPALGALDTDNGLA